ncbi:hypothetical protein [Nocardioides sp. TF02-7]|uniref:hypothetical protein n=1 Tax=Nocardioides sp. TF02-7 TaxID=2917724 RepID=UPI001F05D278|nr:hypothetical protein [Nocardioides sp. TF02-7]UMG91605.1 hypothetical protein MF408_16085 [Nocardioides sp. TF02-7]
MTIRPLLRRLARPSRARRHVVQSVAASSMLTMVAVATVAVTLANQEPQASSAAEAVTSTPPATPPTSAFVGPVATDDGSVDTRISTVRNVSAELADIPSAATAAYQRAESVMAEADSACQLRWTLVAAVGQVVSDHGRRGDGTITDKGVVRPALVGPAVRNQAGRRLSDTDAGKYDGDERHDRAVGPMQLAPTTWSSVGVDGDGDGRRDPQDLDDAALAVAVLICAGDHDLRETDQLREAVERVNDDASFVDTVLAVYDTYNEQLEADPPDIVDVPVIDPPDLPDVVPARNNDGSKPGDDKADDKPTGTPDPTDEASQEPSDPVTFAPVGNGPKGSPKPTDKPPDGHGGPVRPVHGAGVPAGGSDHHRDADGRTHHERHQRHQRLRRHRRHRRQRGHRRHRGHRRGALRRAGPGDHRGHHHLRLTAPAFHAAARWETALLDTEEDGWADEDGGSPASGWRQRGWCWRRAAAVTGRTPTALGRTGRRPATTPRPGRTRWLRCSRRSRRRPRPTSCWCTPPTCGQPPRPPGWSTRTLVATSRPGSSASPAARSTASGRRSTCRWPTRSTSTAPRRRSSPGSPAGRSSTSTPTSSSTRRRRRSRSGVGPFDDDTLDSGLVAVEDGIVSDRDGEDLVPDLTAAGPLSPIGVPVRMAQADGRIALSPSTPLVRAWRAAGESLADDPAVAAVADALDQRAVVSAALTRTADGPTSDLAFPSYDVVGIGWAVDDGEPVTHVAYHFASAADAADAVDPLSALYRDGTSAVTKEPYADWFSVLSAEAHDEVVVVTVTAADGRPDRLHQALMAREPLFVSP